MPKERKLPLPTQLRVRRLEAGLTLHELAERTGLSVPTLSRYERNLRRPSQHDRRALNAAIRLAYVAGLRAELKEK